MDPDELEELQQRLAELAQASKDEQEAEEAEEPSPDTARGGRRYQRLIESERPTVPPPKQSHVRAITGEGAPAESSPDDTADLPAIPAAPRLPKTSTSSS